MRTRIIACLVSCVLGACVVSVQPVVPGAAASFDARLLGRWAEVDGHDRIIVSSGDSNAYAIEYIEGEGRVGKFVARLGRLGQRMVLDVQPAPRDSSPMPEAPLLIRGHVLFAITVSQDSAQLSLLSETAFRDALRSKAIVLDNVFEHDQVVLTGPTAELRRALAPYLGRRGALDEPSTWRRMP